MTNLWNAFLTTAHGWGMGSMVLRFILAAVAGTLIGIDREFKNRGAGVKTHVLVCIGAAMAIMTSQFIGVTMPEMKSDISRLGAQVISGVGFLGVGTIIVTGKNQVRGLTTAAGLWASACVGLAFGIGFAEGGLIATALILFTLKVLNQMDLSIHKNARIFDLYIEFASNESLIQFKKELRQKGVRITNFNVAKNAIKGAGPTATMTVEIPKASTRGAFIEDLNTIDYIIYAEEL